MKHKKTELVERNVQQPAKAFSILEEGDNQNLFSALLGSCNNAIRINDPDSLMGMPEVIQNCYNDGKIFTDPIIMCSTCDALGKVQELNALLKEDIEQLKTAIGAENVRQAIINCVPAKSHHFGVMFSENIGTFIKAGVNGHNIKGDVIMNSQSEYEMINIIVNKGYAEDAMTAARKAGASGGTIIAAKGTAKEGDEKFFGVDIVPEKDMLMILVPADKKEAILTSIKELPCFAKAGSGIIFCNQAEDFTLLGKKN